MDESKPTDGNDGETRSSAESPTFVEWPEDVDWSGADSGEATTASSGCRLSSQEQKRRRRRVVDAILELVVEHRELDDGHALRFEPDDDDVLRMLMAFVDVERRCCPFLRYEVHVEPHRGPLWLKMRGPAQFIEQIGRELDGLSNNTSR